MVDRERICSRFRDVIEHEHTQTENVKSIKRSSRSGHVFISFRRTLNSVVAVAVVAADEAPLSQ